MSPANVDSSKFDHYAVGLVTSVDSINKTGLKKVMVDVTGSGDSIQVLTNTKYVSVNWRVVVAKEGAIVSVDDGSSVQVKKSSVGGTASSGMLCDCPMLGWAGGSKGLVVQLPDRFRIGEQPPETRPKPI